MANQASMVRRQRERQRQQKRREKQARRAERREMKKAADPVAVTEDPMEDPTIDWGSAVRETEVVLNENFEVIDAEEEEESAEDEAEPT